MSKSNRSCIPFLLPLCTVVLLLAASIGVAGAMASPRYQFRIHAEFSGGGGDNSQTSGFKLGQVLDIAVKDKVKHGKKAKLKKLCLSPAPIDRPACTSSGGVAPSATGKTTITATMSNGAKVSTKVSIGSAPTAVNNEDPKYPVPVAATCAASLFADASLAPPAIGEIAAGQQVAVYYQQLDKAKTNLIAQLQVYKTNKSGFALVQCFPVNGYPNS